MQQIENLNQFNTLLDQPEAILFVWVDWSVPACGAAVLVDQFIDQWAKDYPDSNLPISHVDVSKQSGELWDALMDWLSGQEDQDPGRVLYGGGGSMLWIRHGVVDHCAYSPAPINHYRDLSLQLLSISSGAD